MRRAIAAGAVILAAPAALCAQSGSPDTGGVRIFPEVRHFRPLAADPFEPRFAIGLVSTNLFESRGPERSTYPTSPGTGAEVQAAAAIGLTLPIVELLRWPDGGVSVSATGGVFARFRISQPSRDDLGQDWFVGMPIEMAWGESSMRVRVIHRSSHLGDEFSESTGAERIEFGGEALDFLMAREVNAIRFYGGGGWIFHSNTKSTRVLRSMMRSDRYTLQAGMDGEWRPFENPGLSILAGADWQSAERTKWRATFALSGGIQAAVGSGLAALMLRYTDGRSALGQFFLTPERVWSLELILARD